MTTVTLARKLQKDGLTLPKIATEMAKQGAVSPRTGKAYSQAGVSYLLNAKARKKAKAAKTGAGAKAAKTGAGAKRLNAVKSVLGLAGMSAEERIALASLILE